MQTDYGFNDLLDIVAVLRSEEGCPWDRAQTHDSLKQCLIEEAYEVCEAIDIENSTKDANNLCEELGDVLLQVVMHSQIAKEDQQFGIDEVIDQICKKMIRRHPHVFEKDASKELDSNQLVEQWDEIKKKEKKQDSLEETLLEVPKAFPALIRASKIQKKAQKFGFCNEKIEDVIKELEKGLKDIENTVKLGSNETIPKDFEKMMFNMVKLSRFLQLNAENSLTNCTNKFINRLIDVEHLAMANGAHLCDMSIDELNALWEQVNNQNDYIKRRINTLEEE